MLHLTTATATNDPCMGAAFRLRFGSVLFRKVDCIGELVDGRAMSASASNMMAKRWIRAIRIVVVEDANAETLRSLEIIQLCATAYQSTTSQWHEAYCVPPLLPFPAPDEASERKHSGQKRKHLSSSLDSAVAVLLPVAPILRPSTSETATLSPEHNLTVSSTELTQISEGLKTLEIRLNMAPYSIIRTGDHVTFNRTVQTTVTGVRKYSVLDSIIETENLAGILPNATALFVGGTTLSSKAAVMRWLRQFFSVQEEEQYGLVVLQLQVAKQTTAAPVSAEEMCIFEHMQRLGGRGVALSDLQTVLPAHCTDKITEALVNLQMDGVVYEAHGKYLLL
ncbi:TPA: hypothetical protein N0F65_002840 [Lagenidium giganteum]|uniref:Replication protein A C-terminal domain-containing protein n=1 Tax=Lagenidium giganteum TaxID=4803 RepID=A0AAV2ZDM0_9STRA|nr:TPA: hypothetical protein N0F65_002840 [Lagenidium giganteum]